MCLCSVSLEPFISTRIIPVYKVLIKRDRFYGIEDRISKCLLNHEEYRYCHISPYCQFEYIKGKNCAQRMFSDKPIMIEDTSMYSVGYGWLHSYLNEEQANALAKKIEQPIIPPYGTVEVVKMYIPENTRYYINKNCTEICSEVLFWE